jgi:hypothetical protein
MMGEERPGVIRCPSCGRMNRATREICAACGASLGRAGAPAAPRPSAPSAPRPSLTRAAPLTEWGGPSEFGVSAPRPSRSYGGRRGGLPQRERRWGLIVVGAIFLIIAALLLAFGAAAYTTTTNKQIPVNNSWALTNTGLTSESAQISWRGSPSTMHVYLVSGKAGCPASGNILVNRTGARGTFSVTFQAGATYQLFACSNGQAIELNATLTLTGGVSWGDAFGISLLVLGLPFLLIGLRGRSPSAYGD